MFVAIDFETANSDHKSVVSVGIAFRKNNHIFSKEWLIKPPVNTIFEKKHHIDIHGITPDKVKDSPYFPVVWQEIKQIIGDSPVLIAHNAKSAERSYLRSLFTFYNMGEFDLPILCTQDMSQEYFPQLFSFGLANMTRWFEIKLTNHHNAEDDAIACLELYAALQCQEKRDCLSQKIRHYYKENYAFDCYMQANEELKFKLMNSIEKIINMTDDYFTSMNIVFSGGFDFEKPKKIGNSQVFIESHDFVESLIKHLGANYQKRVTRKTDILILSPYYYELSTKNKHVSTNYINACQIQEKGGSIQIIPWSEFLKICLTHHKETGGK